jgi:hypothetical protein
MHLYWLLKDTEAVADIGRVEGMLRRISDYFQCKSEVAIDAALRLPGTANAKDPVHTKPCYIEHINARQRYRLDDFEDMDLRIIIPSKRPPKPFQLPPLPQSRVRVIREPETCPFPREEPAVTVTSMDTVVAEVEAQLPPDRHPGLAADSMEKLTERFIEAFSDRMLDRLADKIVEKLAQRFGAINRKQ